jgi:type IV pilus assembly protein PilC
LVYPVVVISIAMVITAFLIIKVVPVFADVFKDFGRPLPGPTQLLVDLSQFSRDYWWAILLGIAGIYFALKVFLRTENGQLLWDKYQLKLPVFGPLLHKIAMTRFARTFAQLIRSGVPILETLDIVGGSAGNRVIEQAIRSVSTDVERGDNLSVALSKKTIFPPMMLRMVAAGESTGKIDEMLEKMADFWDEEIEATLTALTSLLEPILIVILGVVVGGIVLCMFLPIFQLPEIVSGG